MAVVCVGVAIAVWLRDGDMQGPYGRFPEPVAQQPPVGAARLMATGRRDMLVYGGLAITTGAKGNSGGVYAINIATGRVYWHYDRPSFPIAIDHRSAAVIVRGDKGDSLTEINARSGRIHWSTSPPDIGPVNRVLVPETATKNLILFGADGIAGIDRATGTTRWKKRWPAHTGCSATPISHVVVVGGTVAVECVEADVSNDHVRGFNIATGRQWVAPITQLFPPTGARRGFRLIGDGDQDQLAVTGVMESDQVVLLDPVTGKVRTHRVAKAEFERVFRDGVQVARCNLGGKKLVESFCGSDANTGRRLWGTPLPDGMGFSASLSMSSEIFSVANNHCVYVLADRNPATKDYRAGIVVFDSRTGRLRGSWPLPPDFRSLGGLVQPITDGIITVRGNKGDYLYADSPSITSPRQLFAR
jgi:outer membrane protein assembly factor BamB